MRRTTQETAEPCKFSPAELVVYGNELDALRHLVDHASLTIRQLEELYPNVSRRTLQRDLHALEEQGFVTKMGDTNQLNYRLAQEL